MAELEAERTKLDNVVLKHLAYDTRRNSGNTDHSLDDHGSDLDNDDETVVKLLADMAKEPVVFTTWDTNQKDTKFQRLVLAPYVTWANNIVRRPADIVFLTHIIIYSSTLLTSAIYLFYDFHWVHAVLHLVLSTFCAGPWTLLLHNHIHNNGVLAKQYRYIDRAFPYVLGPLMGHTWNSYYYHHVKHHHVENNGPGDLSSTIRYQRDELTDFIRYVGRFLLLTWLELPYYFLRKGKPGMAAKAFAGDTGCTALMLFLASLNLRPALFTLLLPLSIMRIGMMTGNWGQHAFVDDVEPTSDFRSSITLIDTASNRYCFNDGYHTSHHLNPRRHWRDHPAAFVKAKDSYRKEGALTFQDMDYLFLTINLVRKNYDTLAKHLVPMGEQIHMTHEEKIAMLKSKTRKFTEEQIQDKFRKGPHAHVPSEQPEDTELVESYTPEKVPAAKPARRKSMDVKGLRGRKVSQKGSEFLALNATGARLMAGHNND